MLKRLMPVVITFAALIVFCGKDKGTNGGDGVKESLTSEFERDTTAIRAILTANNLADFYVNTSEIRRRDDVIYGKPRVIGLFLTQGKLDGNHLTVLPAAIGQLTGLTELWLDSNQLTSLPPEIGQLTNLTSLRIGDNQLSSLPAQIGNLDSLHILILSGNQLASLPPEIGQLSALQVLRVDHNLLTGFPNQAVGMVALRTLDFAANSVCTTPSGEVVGWLDGIEYLAGIDWAGTDWQTEFQQDCN